MKKLQLYRINSVDDNLDSIKNNSIENPKNSEYFSIYSENVDLILLDKDINYLTDSESSNKNFFHPNSNLNEFHKMIQLKIFKENVNKNRNNTINSKIMMKDKFITIHLNTREKLSEINK
jgi:hypothetical protein